MAARSPAQACQRWRWLLPRFGAGRAAPATGATRARVGPGSPPGTARSSSGPGTGGSSSSSWPIRPAVSKATAGREFNLQNTAEGQDSGRVPPAFYATPAVSDGRLYAASYSGVRLLDDSGPRRRLRLPRERRRVRGRRQQAVQEASPARRSSRATPLSWRRRRTRTGAGCTSSTARAWTRTGPPSAAGTPIANPTLWGRCGPRRWSWTASPTLETSHTVCTRSRRSTAGPVMGRAHGGRRGHHCDADHGRGHAVLRLVRPDVLLGRSAERGCLAAVRGRGLVLELAGLGRPADIRSQHGRHTVRVRHRERVGRVDIQPAGQQRTDPVAAGGRQRQPSSLRRTAAW